MPGFGLRRHRHRPDLYVQCSVQPQGVPPRAACRQQVHGVWMGVRIGVRIGVQIGVQNDVQIGVQNAEP